MLLIASALASTVAPGTFMEKAAAVHITNNGLRHLGDGIEGLVPPVIPVNDVAGDFECEEGATPLHYELSTLELYLKAEDVDVQASDGRLDITLYMSLSSSASTLDVTGDCSFLADLEESCGVELPTTSVVAHIGMQLALVDGVVDATVEDPTVEISPIGNPLSDCVLADAFGTLLNQDPEAISLLLASFITPSLAGLGADLESSVEDALGGLALDTSLALGGGEVALKLQPTLLRLDETGLVLGLGGSATPSVVSDCVPESAGSESMDADWPTFGETAWDTSLEYDLGLYLGKDFLDQVLWNVWAGGALCLDIADLGGAPLTTELGGQIFGDDFSALFTEGSNPMRISTRPEKPPVAVFTEDVAPLRIGVTDLGLDVSTSLDARQLRLFRVGVNAEIGIEPHLTSTQLAPELVIDPAAIDFTEPVNEFLPSGFSAGIADFLPTVLGSLLPDDLLPTVTIPSLLGIGLKETWWLPAEDQSWQGGFVLLDVDNVTPIEVAGCSGDALGCGGGGGLDLGAMLGCAEGGGCGADSGCEGGSSCSVAGHGHKGASGGIPVRAALGALVLSLAVLRRRG